MCTPTGAYRTVKEVSGLAQLDALASRKRRYSSIIHNLPPIGTAGILGSSPKEAVCLTMKLPIDHRKKYR